jgi:thiosulfate/3-mercaptopyruvate sulfurtransferase
MKSLGHENVRMLDGNVEDWAEAGKPVTRELTKAPRKTYTPVINQDFTATYDYVKNGSAQIVDARTIQEFGANSIPGSINIPYTSVIIDNKIGDETRLAKVFAILNKNRPVVVYTNTGIKGSVVWFSLMLQGYDAKLYSYQNYLINQVVSNQAISGNDTN